jgi:6-phosphofructokinase 1
MTAGKGNLVVAQGGGPTAVVNASLYGVVREAAARLDASARIWGARGGILGVLHQHWTDLRRPNPENWEAIAASPGAALGSCRKMLTQEEAAEAVRVLKAAEVRYFVYIGGNDSMDTALKMSHAAAACHYDLHVAGAPKTIDNDLPLTDHCPGFGSAARYFAQAAIDLSADVRALPVPVSILEVMGRNAGWLTAATVLAKRDPDDGPHLIYVPEAPVSAGRFLRDVERVHARQGWVVAAVSEGLRDENGRSLSGPRDKAAVDGFGHALPGDVAAALARLVTSELGLRARSEKPGLCGRACALMVSPVDRREARESGQFAAAWAIQGHSGFMASIQRAGSGPYAVEYRPVPLAGVANLERRLPPEYVNAECNGVEESYRDYVEPLIGGPLLRYPRLDTGKE